MTLNDTIPDLPEWPPIEVSENGRDIIVHARHVTHGRWLFMKWLFRLAGVWALWAVCKHTYETQPKTLIIMPVVVLTIYTIVANALPTVKWMTWLFFRRHTVVRFTDSSITVNGKSYDIAPQFNILFRAARPTLPPNKQFRAERSRATKYELEFRTVEMIYGSRPVPITSIADEQRAEQFAIALQRALQMIAQKQLRAVQASPASKSVVDDTLPE